MAEWVWALEFQPVDKDGGANPAAVPIGDVLGASVTYGKRGDALAYSGGSMVLQLDNTTSAYTPGGGGTYSNARFLGVQVKLYADVTGAGAPTWTHGPPAAFTGYVTDIDYTFADSYNATVNVTVSDALTMLGTLSFDGGQYGFTLDAGPTPFSPLDLSPTLWLDASDTSTITETSNLVSQWDDKSGNANHAVQATASLQPLTNTNTLNSLNVLKFASDEMNNTVAIASASTVVFIVSTWNAAVRNGLYGGPESSDPGLFQNSVGSTTWKSEPATATTYQIGSGSTGSILTVSHGSTSYVRKDGVLLAESGGPQSSTAGKSITTYGKLGRAGVRMNGDIAEIIIVDGTLTSQQISDTETYLANKWGITL